MQDYTYYIKLSKAPIPSGTIPKEIPDEIKEQENHILDLIAVIGESEGTEALKEEIKRWKRIENLKVSNQVIDLLRGEQAENTAKAAQAKNGILGALITRSYVAPFEEKSKKIETLIAYLLSLCNKIK